MKSPATLGLALALSLLGCGSKQPGILPTDAPQDSPPAEAPTTPPVPTGFVIGTAGPWPAAPLTVLDSAAGLDRDVVDASTDEAQNIWVVASEALYLLEPGQTQFRKYTVADGLNLDNADPPFITAVCGGAPGEVWVGYKGSDVTDVQTDPRRFRGKLDRVLLKEDKSLQVIHYDVHNNDAVGFDAQGNVIRLPNGKVDPQFTDWSFNEDRTVLRFLYDHLYHRGTMYVGYNHGVARIDAGRIDPITGFDYADHIHPVVRDATGTERMGDWHALALDPTVRTDRNGQPATGMLWMGGRWTGGASAWTPALFDWARNERNPFWIAFTTRPIFPVAPGDDVYIRGIAPLSDGTVVFASGIGNSGTYSPRGLARWKQFVEFDYLSPGDLGLPGSDILDVQRLPDDTVLIALPGSLWRWNPNPGPLGLKATRVTGLPGSRIRRVYVDQMVSPVAVYVATDAGVAVLRGL